MRCASPQFFAHRTAHGVSAVGHYRHGIRVAATATHEVVEPMIAGPEVSVAAGLADDASAVKQPRHTLEQTVPNGLRKADVCPTDIANGCKSAIKASMQKRCGVVRKIGHGSLRQTGKVQAGEVDVNVCVNQAGHQHAVAAINDLCIRRCAGRGGNYVFDGRACDHYIVAFDEPFGIAVENARSAKDGVSGVGHG